MDYSGKLAMCVRNIGRELHVLRPVLNAYKRISPNAYEHKFHSALLAAIKPGDNVWDVGANVGFYTQLFADVVGPDGKVIAFEPSPEAFETLRSLAAKKNQHIFAKCCAI